MFRVSGSEWVSLRLRLGGMHIIIAQVPPSPPPPPPPPTHTHTQTHTYGCSRAGDIKALSNKCKLCDVEEVVGVEACSWSVMDSNGNYQFIHSIWFQLIKLIECHTIVSYLDY